MVNISVLVKMKTAFTTSPLSSHTFFWSCKHERTQIHNTFRAIKRLTEHNLRVMRCSLINWRIHLRETEGVLGSCWMNRSPFWIWDWTLSVCPLKPGGDAQKPHQPISHSVWAAHTRWAPDLMNAVHALFLINITESIWCWFRCLFTLLT